MHHFHKKMKICIISYFFKCKNLIIVRWVLFSCENYVPFAIKLQWPTSEPYLLQYATREPYTYCNVPYENLTYCNVPHENPTYWNVPHENPTYCNVPHENPTYCNVPHENPTYCNVQLGIIIDGIKTKHSRPRATLTAVAKKNGSQRFHVIDYISGSAILIFFLCVSKRNWNE